MSDNLEPGRTDMFVPGPHDNAEPHEGVRESALGSRALFPTAAVGERAARQQNACVPAFAAPFDAAAPAA